MHRVDTDTRLVDANGAGKDGWTEGTPPMVPPTRGSDDFFNDLQENICQAIEAAGITLVKGTHTQLTAAIRALVDDTILPVTVSGAGAVAGVTDLTLSGEVLYETPKTRVMYIPVSAGLLSDNAGALEWTTPGTVPSEATSIAGAGADVYFELSRVPNEATITQIRVLVDPTTNMSFRAYRHTVSGTTISSTQTSSFPAVGGTKQWIDSGAIALTGGVGVWREILVHAGTDGGEKVHLVEITYTDVGPKNHT